MTRRKAKRTCRGCRTKPTRSVTGLCERCRTGRSPTVTRDANGGIHIEGLGRLTHAAALALAHKIADELTP